MKRRLVCLALAAGLALPTTGCAGRGQHHGALPLLLLGGLVVAGVVYVATQGADETCPDPLGRCGGTSYPPPPETQR